MKIAVRFGGEHFDLGVASDDDRVVGAWAGPPAANEENPRDVGPRFAAALEAPRDFPPLSLAVVPGDRVAVALDLDLEPAVVRPILAELARTFAAAEVEDVTIVANMPAPPDLPPGLTWERHDPDDRSRISYLATTKDGQRVYLNRALTDADFVLPVGTLGYDRALGYRGPWSALYPGLSDRETQARFRKLADDAPIRRDEPRPALLESSEVGWLIGCQLQVGVVPAADGGAGEVIAGLESLVRDQGTAAVDRDWTFEAAERADVVIAGIGRPGRFATVDDLGAGLAAATSLVRRGGKVVALARVDGPIGPAVRRLAGAGNPQAALNRLRGHEAEAEYVAARQVAAALAWADVYLHSGLDADEVEDLGIIPLARPEEARKLAGSAASLTVLDHAERTRCLTRDDES